MTILDNLRQVDTRITRACEIAERERNEVVLELAVKTQPWERIREAIDGLRELGLPIVLGHNHVQEVVATYELIREYAPEAQIHQIGHLQSNKISAALTGIDVLESLDSVGLVERLVRRLERDYPQWVLPVFLEVNVSGESAKHGVSLEQAPSLIEKIIATPQLKLSGFMTVGALSSDREEVASGFRQLAKLASTCTGITTPSKLVADSETPVPVLPASGQNGLELSMGMSGDLEIAIAEGATIVRIGTDVFGARNYRK